MKTRFYLDADDKNVAAPVIYASYPEEGDAVYSYDEAGEDIVDADDYLHLFAVGAVFVYEGAYRRPVGFENGDFVFAN